ncbi:efflux RND transporter permease subunit [Haliangium ochraceum]|uniref:Heavy metal efflux pump, CzcA family n=1 Tax=Haliangium ochraceum (strain DSM 14365 / JCM 11303 / SMP-2) TaxID=502025 RepID=D0LMA5_HALO1|nr:CusA/CzcA family heavy metal efflux RND transporter [Haliangium ochraceum]ACY16811.1 heavy metal efflux pump, CzcA family [Haliangium ochraceum DSM 14365]
MLDRLVAFSIRNRLLVIFVVLLVGAIGVRALQRLPIDAVPDVTNVQVQVLTNAPSLGPAEVEQFITFPVETVMSGLPGLEEVRSISRFGLSAVTVVFEEGTDIYFARQLVGERLSEARESIAAAYGAPEMGPISTGLGEIYQFEVSGEPGCGPGAVDTEACYSPMELRELLDWYIAYQLRMVEGVVEVNSFGGELKTYQVTVHPDRLVAFGLDLSDVFEALEQNNQNAGGGYLIHDGEQRLIRGEGLVTSLADLADVVVATREDSIPIRIGDVADVELAPMIRQGAVTRDGRGEVVTGVVMMLMDENSREVSRAVHERIQDIAPTLPEGVTIDTFYDRTELVNRTIRTVAVNLIEGGVLVVVVLLLLLGNLRGGLLVASAIPLSMLAAFIAMNEFGVSGNLMSLGALDFGLIVDGSVVMVEHIVHALGKRGARGDQVADTVLAAAKEIARPVAFAVVIIVLVYVPILSLRGIEGKMFRPMALTVIFALLASLVLALTFMPAMASALFRGGVRERETWLLRQLKRLYEPALAWTLRRPVVPAGVALALLLGAGVTVTQLGAEFIPRLDEGAIAMQAVRLPAVPLEESVRYTTRIEQSLLEHFPDEVVSVISRTGRAEIATDPMGVELSDIFIMLTPPAEWTRASSKEALVEAMQATLMAEVPGQNYLFSQPIELRTNELISGVRADIAIKVYGDDLDTLAQLSGEIEALVRAVPGAGDVESEQVAGLPFLRVRVDRQAIARYGVSVAEVMNAVSAVAGHVVGEIFEGQRRFALQVRLAGDTRHDIDAIRQVPIRTPAGTTVPVGELAELRFEDGPAQIGRENVQRRVAIMANVRGRDLASFVAEAKQRIDAELRKPPGYVIEWGGQFKNLEEASERLAVAVPAALVTIFLLLYMTYGSFRPALLIYLNVPFAALGGVFALALRGMPLSISAGVGFIALFGIAVLNGVVLVSHVRALQVGGMELAEAARVGARDRLRPVLMTALVASLGFVPMALATSAGAEVQRPLATVVIGGLISATLLTLLVLPAMYSRFGGLPPLRRPRATSAA